MKPTILVVEDEAVILMDAVGFLEEAGFTCLEAVNVAEASRLLHTHPEIVALFTDIEMKGARNGLDLAREAHHLRPDLRLLIASGRVCPMPGQLPPHSVFVAKPYRHEVVTDALQGLMAA